MHHVTQHYTFACWKEWVSRWKEHSYVDTLARQNHYITILKNGFTTTNRCLGVTHARKKLFHTNTNIQQQSIHHIIIYLWFIRQCGEPPPTHGCCHVHPPNLPEYHPLKDLKSQLHAPTQMGGFAEFLMRPFTRAQINKQIDYYNALTLSTDSSLHYNASTWQHVFKSCRL